MFLPDINVWLALAFRAHSHHAPANVWYESTGERCLFCRLTQQGFLRLATNPKIWAKDTLSPDDPWRLYETMVGDPRIGFAAEPNGVEEQWRECTRGQSFSKDLWSDAYLAAFARAASLDLVTFDKGFTHSRDVKCTTLS